MVANHEMSGLKSAFDLMCMACASLCARDAGTSLEIHGNPMTKEIPKTQKERDPIRCLDVKKKVVLTCVTR